MHALVLFLILSATLLTAARPKRAANDEAEEPTVDEIPQLEGQGLPKVEQGDEMYHSKTPPTYMRCDCCAATAFWIHRAFKLAHKERFMKKLKLDKIYETVDDICLPKTFSRTYGIKNIDGRPRLSGGGLKWFYHQSPASGTLMPGQWLNHQCRETQGEISEEELYDLFWKYHVTKGHEKSDVPFFLDVCVKTLKKCSKREAFESYDGIEEGDLEKKW